MAFILLMFFMLMSTFTRWKAVALQFPVADSGVDQKNPQAVILHMDGSLSLRSLRLFLPESWPSTRPGRWSCFPKPIPACRRC